MDEAIDFVGGLLVGRGCVDASYVVGMKTRETVVSTYLGNGVALPHGMLENKASIVQTGIVVAQYPAGVDWNAGTAHLVVGLAAVGEEHLAVMSQLAEVLQDEDLCEQLAETTDAAWAYDVLTTPAVDDEDTDE